MSMAMLAIHRIHIDQNLGAADKMGGTPESWSRKYSDVAARVRPLSVRERGLWLGMPVMASHAVYVPNASLDIDEKCRVLFGVRTFNIIGVTNPHERGDFLRLDCEEVKE